MYRLLAVDDEAIITDGVTEIIGGLNIPGLDICKAYSGMEALEWLDSTRVDIVLSDIRMPELDGLELMDIIRGKWPRCRIIFLTGYDDFESVYKAIQIQGVRFLLKTEGYAKVIAEVRDSIRELEEELRTDHLLRQATEQRSTLETMAQGDYFRQLLIGTEFIEAEERAADFRNLSICLDSFLPVLPVLGSFLKTSPGTGYTVRQEMALAAKFLVGRYLQDRTRCVGIVDRYGDLLWLIQPQNSDAERMESYADVVRFLEGTLELAQEACSEALGTEMAFTLSGHACEWNLLPSAYDRIRQLQHVRIGDGTSMVMTAAVAIPQDPAMPGQPRGTIRSERFELLAGHLESGRSEAFQALMKEVFQPLHPNHGTDKIQAMELYYSAALVLLSYINRRQLEDLVPISGLMQFDAHPSWEEGVAYLERTVETLFAHRRCGEGSRAAGAVQEIGAYIEKHLDEDLSLVRLSKRFHFNPSYLSRVFKQESGMNLSDFIERARLRRAKELLGREGLRINEIGAKVGYESPHSFSRFFKKSTGTTPQEYRDAARGLA
ncbi:response regulator transcription factor [Cohnella herbarum]|uniref:Helix-turn-helix domain-containing protein n=1 Tax=Cohnella herbarum TaxID=2728023 RepID=A0A7Z2VJ61_9BACL|nr:helix-turn-helix domain-containing protein [Cohnella herbarum]QJD84024.1 helix-turn-helix domain-containing protein [Cohnella herbarum]